MRRNTLLTGILTLLLWAPLAAAETGALDPAYRAKAPALTAAALESSYETPASETESAALAGPLLETLSPILLVTMGVVGLFWVRRHTAEL